MSKGNLFLGFARGKVGDVVFSHTNGEQVTRARNRSPRNPQTAIQLVQRSILKTVSQAYGLMSPICDHAFEGLQQGTMSQSEFTRRNVALLRTVAAEVINSADPEEIISSALTNFAGKATFGALVNPYIVAAGNLPAITPVVDTGAIIFAIPYTDTLTESPTYQQVVDGLGLKRGDQITVVALSVNDTADAPDDVLPLFNGFVFGRIILEPASGDMSTAFFGSNHEINDPNPKNEGVFTLYGTQPTDQNWNMRFVVSGAGYETATGQAKSIAAGAVIVSRLEGTVWKRSDAQLVLRTSNVSVTGHLTQDHQTALLGDAVLSFMTADNSSLYLNQAE